MAEDRDSIEKEIRLRIDTESNTHHLVEIRGMIERRWRYEDERWVEMDKRLDKIEAEISVYKYAIRFMKAGALTVAAILAFKFGDIKGLWK